MSSQFKIITLYDAETKTRKSKGIKKSMFQSEDEMDEFIYKMRQEQKNKNREYKARKIAENILLVAEKLNGDEKVVELDDITHLTAKTKADKNEKLLANVDEQLDIIARNTNSGIPQLEVKINYSSDVNLRLDKNTGNTCVIFGSSKRGKTTLMMYLYEKYYSNKNNITTLFSGNPHLRIYKNSNKKDDLLLIGYGFNQRHSKYVQMQKHINVKTKNQYEFVNLFDDIIDAKYSKIVNDMILTYRNANISTIMCLQYVCMLSKQNRGSVNNTFVFGANSTEDAAQIIERVLKSYFVDMGLKDLNAQLAFYKKATENYGFMYIDNIKNKISFHRLSL